jgi:hypothetical protein
MCSGCYTLNRKIINKIANGFKTTWSLLFRKESNQDAKCSREKNWMKSVLVLKIVSRNPLDTLRRRLGFKVSDVKFRVCSNCEKDLQNVNLNFQAGAGSVYNKKYFRHLLWSVLSRGLVDWAAVPYMRGKGWCDECVSPALPAERSTAGCQKLSLYIFYTYVGV